MFPYETTSVPMHMHITCRCELVQMSDILADTSYAYYSNHTAEPIGQSDDLTAVEVSLSDH